MKSKPVGDQERTPFELDALRGVASALKELPKIGEPYRGGHRMACTGAEYENVRDWLLPAVKSLFAAGYTKKMILRELSERLKVGTSNRYLVHLVKEAFAEYHEEMFGGGGR